MRERIGLLGGSFNPIHLGHLAMARAAREALGLDRVLLVPDGSPPHKSRGLADRHDRLAMVRLAAQDEFEVSDMETERPGKTYTVDTLEALRAQWPEAELWMIIGGDTLGEIGGWKRAERVFSLCRFAAFRREGLPFPQPPEGAEVTPLSAAIPPISATAIRARIHKGLGLEGWTPSAVEDYIGARRLYDPPEQLSGKAMRKRLAATLPKKRMVHVEGVEAVIRALARRWGADEKKAALAALLHDCAKGMDLPAMLAWADRWEVPLDSLRRTSTALLHAPVGAAMARAEYGVTDPDVLHAIRYHNTGCVPMRLLDKLLYLADMTEPSRRSLPWLEALRAQMLEDLDGALVQAMRHKLDYILARGGDVHPDTSSALEAMENRQTCQTREENG